MIVARLQPFQHAQATSDLRLVALVRSALSLLKLHCHCCRQTSARLWGPSYTTASLSPGAQHQVLAKLTSADFRILPGYTMCVINRQFIPLEVDNVGPTQALLSRQSASLD